MRSYMVAVVLVTACNVPEANFTPIAQDGTAESCTDSVKNGSETDVDCGGSCPMRCGDNLACAAPGDCGSGVCIASKCAAPTCTDTVKNDGETDVDCGGSCPGCATGGRCASSADCASGTCDNDTCRAPASCFELQAAGATISGTYLIDLDKSGPLPPQPIFCDMTSDGGGWTLVFNHQTIGGYFSDAGEAASSNEDDPTMEKYSILNKLQNLQRGGAFTFRIDWPGYTKHNIWLQTTSPTADIDVAGYNAIDVQVTSNFWGGLELSNGTHGPGSGSSYIDGSINHSNWFYAIGVYSPTWCSGGIPAADDLAGSCTPVQWVQLWVR